MKASLLIALTCIRHRRMRKFN